MGSQGRHVIPASFRLQNHKSSLAMVLMLQLTILVDYMVLARPVAGACLLHKIKGASREKRRESRKKDVSDLGNLDKYC